MEATGPLWEALYDPLTHAGYTVLRLKPRQTASWATSLGQRAKTDELDAQTLARGLVAGLVAGLARARCLPSETVQALRALTRARRDLIESRTAARQRLHDELVVRFPAFVRFLPTLPGRTDLGEPAVRPLVSRSSSARALADVPLEVLRRLLAELSEGRWGQSHASALQELARRATASSRAVAARSVVARTLAPPLRELAAHSTEREAASAALRKDDAAGRQLPGIPGIGPQGAATIRAALGRRQSLRPCRRGGGLRGPGSAHASERRVGRAEAPVQARTRRRTPCARSGGLRRRARCPRVAPPLPTAARSRAGQERSLYDPGPRPLTRHLPPPAHGPTLRSCAAQQPDGAVWLLTPEYELFFTEFFGYRW
jgi:hypothetical protein